MAESSNGTTFTFGATAQGDVRSIDFDVASAEIDVTTLGSAQHLYEAGLPDVTCTLEVLGESAIEQGDTGALAISWNSGGAEGSGQVPDITTVVVTGRSTSASIDSEITTNLTMKVAS